MQLRLKLIYREKRGIEGCAAFDICQGHTPVFKDLHTPDILSSAHVYLHIYKSAQAPEVSICVVYQTEETKKKTCFTTRLATINARMKISFVTKRTGFRRNNFQMKEKLLGNTR